MPPCATASRIRWPCSWPPARPAKGGNYIGTRPPRLSRIMPKPCGARFSVPLSASADSRAGVTLLVLTPAAAGAGFVAPGVGERVFELGLFLRHRVHDLARGMPLAQQTGHHPHVRIHVPEVSPQPGAEIVQSRLAIRRNKETMLGTFSVAFKQESAFPAISGKPSAFVFSEPALPFRIHQLSKWCA